MLSSEVSCSDCKIELIEKKWTKLMLKWLSKCVYEDVAVRQLNMKCLSDLMTKYRKDVCIDDVDRAILCTDDMEPFIRYKYPILQLRYLTEGYDIPKKLYIMASILLYHCCVNSQTGVVDEEMGRHLSKYEQELVLKYCEKLSEMETTINNVEMAIRGAFESVTCMDDDSKLDSSIDMDESRSSVAHMSAESTIKSSATMLPSDTSSLEQGSVLIRYRISKFASSMTVMPSAVTDSSTYSEPPTNGNDANGQCISENKTSSDSMEKVVPNSEPTRELSYLDNDNAVANEQKKKTGGFAVINPLNFVKRDILDVVEERNVKMEKGFMTHANNLTNKSEGVLMTEICKFNEKNTVGAALRKKIVNMETNAQNTVLATKPKRVVKDKEVPAPPKPAIDGPKCQDTCSCTRCMFEKTSCGEPGGTMDLCREKPPEKPSRKPPRKPAKSIIEIDGKVVKGWTNFELDRNVIWAIAVVGVLLVLGIIVAIVLSMRLKIPPQVQPLSSRTLPPHYLQTNIKKLILLKPVYQNHWLCENSVCIKVREPTFMETFPSYGICLLKCSGPSIWPLPSGVTRYADDIVLLSTHKLEYRFDTVHSDSLREYLAEALKLFIGDLAQMEDKITKYRNSTELDVKKVVISIDIKLDPDPKLRLDTDESYSLNLDSYRNRIEIKISSMSFCGARHALETLCQMILMDHSSGYLITVASAEIKDRPSFKYRGLMIDTGRNYIPVPDIMKTIDGMATVKLNTFHWRVSDVTSFPLVLPKFPQLFQYGAYDRSMVYTKEDVKTIAKRAWIRGIRIVMEVTAPGPVGRPWSWCRGATCSANRNDSCDNVLCLKLQLQPYVMNIFEAIYMEILEMTQVTDVFHLSHGTFSLANCFDKMSSRNGYLEAVLARLKTANKGLLPKLPIIWYSSHLQEGYEAKTWEYFGVQLSDWKSENHDKLSKYKLIYSGKWQLSCEMKNFRCKRYRTWQEMYSWRPWMVVESFSVEGGEALLWTDLINSGNLDYHLWPRLAAVAERLWADAAINSSVDAAVYLRLNSYRFRLQRYGITVQPIWPTWCFYSPTQCLAKIK